MSTLIQEMTKTVAALSAPSKGILAADESSGTIEKRFKAVGVPSTEQTRRDYRELLFSTPDSAAFISGVILFDETLKQKTTGGLALPELLKANGILCGIKVDIGTVPLPAFPGEKITEGLDGLKQRLTEYKKRGARFAKWRAVISIGTDIPTPQTIAANAHALAYYATHCQDLGLVPIVEAGEKWPHGGWMHGAKGMLQYFCETVGTDDPLAIVRLIDGLINEKVRGH